MPKNWITYKLSEVIQIIGGGTPKTSIPEFWNGSIPWLSVKDFQGEQKFVFQTEKTITEEGLKKSSTKILPKGAIIISARGTVGELAVLEKEMTFNQSCYGILPNNKIDNNYLYYLLKQKIRELQGLSYGSVFDTITTKTFDGLDVYLPPLPEQKQIANILSAIDDKIENNLAINKTLEDMAMALYKHWFVDFGPFQEGEFIDSELGLIPKGWEVKRLDEVAYKNSKTFDFKGKQEVVFVNTGDVQNGSFLHKNYSETEGLPGQAKKVIEPNDILYSEIRPKNKRYAYVDFDSGDYVVSTKFMIIRNNEKINNRLLYRILTRQDSIDEFQMIAESRSGTFPQITFDVIGHFPIVLPNLEIQNKFQSIVDPFEKQQSNNLMEIKSLTNLRDTLLPKLISGEVRLKEFREGIDAEINSA
jgi:type I restriction enzyme S subunit